MIEVQTLPTPTRYEPFWTTVNNSAPLHHPVRQISSVHNLTFYQFQCPSSNRLNLLSPPPGLKFSDVCMDVSFPHVHYMFRSSYT